MDGFQFSVRVIYPKHGLAVPGDIALVARWRA
jgi:hypothetical protein